MGAGLVQQVCGARWLITEDSLRTILSIAAEEKLDPELARMIAEARAARPSALAMRAGAPLDGARSVTVRDGIAMLPVVGPIFRRANLFTEVSGASSLDRLAADLQTAIDSPTVEAIVLAVDSPGGEATGINELGDVIYAARERKPIGAYVEGLGASAAYWLASAAGEIVLDPTAAVGSIGVVLAVTDPTKVNAREIEIVSSRAPNKRPDPTTQKGRAQYQQLVDSIESVFVAAVARNRGTTEAAVLSDFGEGGLLVGAAAVAAGMADRLGSFESLMADMGGRIEERRRERRMGMTPRRMFAQAFAAHNGETA